MPDQADTPQLSGRSIVLGVCGGIAAYKSAEIVRLLKKSGADVNVIMTSNAARFISGLTLSTLAGTEVIGDLYSGAEGGRWTRHVDLGVGSDAILIAPATANTIAKLANGFCDDMLTATVLAARCPVLVCPSMDHDMFVHPATQRNLEHLESFGHEIVAPGHGELASGLEGWGRLPDPTDILSRLVELLDQTRAGHRSTSYLRGRSVLVTAGPTREALDPVRFLTNHSTGTMGFALAAEAARRGADVTLVTGPTAAPTPPGVARVDVVSADDMHQAVQAHREADVVIAAAAVADYTPAEYHGSKIKKTGDELVLTLRKTRDILAELGQEARDGQIRIGFALETDDELENAARKLRDKNLHWIVSNNPLIAGSGFGTGTNRVFLIDRDGTRREIPLMPKRLLAARLLDESVETLNA